MKKGTEEDGADGYEADAQEEDLAEKVAKLLHPYRRCIYGYGYIHGYPRKLCGYGYGWEISYPRQPCENVRRQNVFSTKSAGQARRQAMPQLT